jgi:hypothetical protein
LTSITLFPALSLVFSKNCPADAALSAPIVSKQASKTDANKFRLLMRLPHIAAHVGYASRRRRSAPQAITRHEIAE